MWHKRFPYNIHPHPLPLCHRDRGYSTPNVTGVCVDWKIGKEPGFTENLYVYNPFLSEIWAILRGKTLLPTILGQLYMFWGNFRLENSHIPVCASLSNYPATHPMIFSFVLNNIVCCLLPLFGVKIRGSFLILKTFSYKKKRGKGTIMSRINRGVGKSEI